MNKSLIFLILLLFISQHSYSQLTNNLEFKPFYGRIIPHRLNMESLSKGPAFGAEFNYFFQSKTTNFYDIKFRYPFRGVGVSYEYLGNPEALGSAISAYSFMDFTLLEKSNFTMGIRINAGLAFLTKKYDENKNPNNIAISTTTCFYFNAGLKFAYKFKSDYELKLMPAFIHYSNGAVRKPNLGLNQIVVAVALSKKISERKGIRLKSNYQDSLTRSEFWTMGTLFTSDEYAKGYEGRGGGFLCSTIAAGYNFQYGKIGKVGISLDLLYNENLKYRFDADADELILQNEKFSDVMILGIALGNQLVYKRFELMTFIGAYVRKKVIKEHFIYTRLGGRYYVTNFMFVNLSLVAEGLKAQYVETGIGFSFRKKTNKK